MSHTTAVVGHKNPLCVSGKAEHCAAHKHSRAPLGVAPSSLSRGPHAAVQVPVPAGLQPLLYNSRRNARFWHQRC